MILDKEAYDRLNNQIAEIISDGEEFDQVMELLDAIFEEAESEEE